MNSASKRSFWFRTLFWAMLLLLGVKLGWVLIEVLWLPTQGVEHVAKSRISRLPSRYRLASDAPLPKPVTNKPLPKDTLREMTLLATYLEKGKALAVLRKKGKAGVFAVGEEIGGYRLERIIPSVVVLSRGSREYRLELSEKEGSSHGGRVSSPAPRSSVPRAQTPTAPKEIKKTGNRTIVPRRTLEEYTKNIDKIWKAIAITPLKNGEQLAGFRVRWVKHGSVFEKLGLQRGDVIETVNGEALEDYAVVMDLFRSVGEMETLQLGIKRGGKELELKYEIR